MPLNGYDKNTGKRSGGISKLGIVSAKCVSEIVFDHTKNVCSQIILKEGAEFADYGFCEGEASFTEEVSAKDGVTRVVHTIEFAIERPDLNTIKTLTELIDASIDGLAAIVTTNSGISFLVGYSEKFGTEQPLRLVKSISDTGRKFSDNTFEIITLSSVDDSKAIIYIANQA